MNMFLTILEVVIWVGTATAFTVFLGAIVYRWFLKFLDLWRFYLDEEIEEDDTEEEA